MFQRNVKDTLREFVRSFVGVLRVAALGGEKKNCPFKAPPCGNDYDSVFRHLERTKLERCRRDFALSRKPHPP